MKRILSLWLAAILFAAQPCYAAVIVGFGGLYSQCDGGATDYIGNTTAEGTSSASVTDRIYVKSYTPSCSSGCTSGVFGNGFIYHSTTANTSAIVSIYQDDGDGTPDSGDTLVGSSSTPLSSSITWVSTSADITGSVSCGSTYWVAWSLKGTSSFAVYSGAYGTTYYSDISGASTSAPSTLAGSWTSLTRTYSIYVEIINP